MPSLLLEKVERFFGAECGHHYVEAVNIRRGPDGKYRCDFRCQVCGETHAPGA